MVLLSESTRAFAVLVRIILPINLFPMADGQDLNKPFGIVNHVDYAEIAGPEPVIPRFP